MAGARQGAGGERLGVGYVMGLAKNARLNARTESLAQRLARRFVTTGQKQRAFSQFR
jgi:hypothetical protein